MAGGVRGPGGRSSPSLGGTAQDVSTAASTGTSGNAARADHAHALPSKWRIITEATWSKDSADATALVATAEIPIIQIWNQQTPNRIRFVPSSAVASADSNYATLKVYKRNGAGGAATAIASAVTSSTAMAAYQGWALTINDGAAIPSGYVLSFEITKAGTGAVIPTGVLYCEMLID